MTQLDEKFNLVDEAAPIGSYLSAHYKRGFAHYTVRDRLPVILTRIVDSLSRVKENLVAEFGEKCREEVKDIVGKISKLKYELQTDKPFKLLEDNASDVSTWNEFIINSDEDKRSYYSAVWLHAECYLYRRLRSMFLECSTLRGYDYFRQQKQDSFTGSVPAFIGLAKHMTVVRQLQDTAEVRRAFHRVVKANLWGNRIDLSLSGGGPSVMQNDDPMAMIASLEDNILANDLDSLWAALTVDEGIDSTMDIVHDNAGYELFTDLILIDFLLTHNIATRIRCHVKSIPWFVSDVTAEDFEWTLNQLNSSDHLEVRGFGMRLREFVQAERLVYTVNDFWTSPYDFVAMPKICPELYKSLCSSKCVIFKGDLNYRKLMGDINWDPTTDFTTALRTFRPTNVCALRTIKADTVSGLKTGVSERLTETYPKWMETGEYGLIQCSTRRL